jgi:hypothetical protein
MKYRSSVTTFAKALLCEAATNQGPEIVPFDRYIQENGLSFRQGFEKWLGEKEHLFLAAAKSAMPENDWTEIIDYICRYHTAYNYRLPLAVRNRVYFLLPWLAAIAVCALDDMGR